MNNNSNSNNNGDDDNDIDNIRCPAICTVRRLPYETRLGMQTPKIC